MKPILRQLIGITALAALATTAAAAERSPSAQAFERLASLVGEWKAVQGSDEARVTYTLTGDGSTLMEEFRPGGRRDDGDDVLGRRRPAPRDPLLQREEPAADGDR
jgi:hypothetical protein